MSSARLVVLNRIIREKRTVLEFSSSDGISVAWKKGIKSIQFLQSTNYMEWNNHSS